MQAWKSFGLFREKALLACEESFLCSEAGWVQPAPPALVLTLFPAPHEPALGDRQGAVLSLSLWANLHRAGPGLSD